VDEPDPRNASQLLEERPVARTDRGAATHVPTRGERLGRPLGEAVVASLEVEHELGAAVEGREELSEDEPPAERVREPPSIPQERNRSERLQVAYFHAPPEEVDVRLDRLDPERLGGL
jgi:hypothetical protein